MYTVIEQSPQNIFTQRKIGAFFINSEKTNDLDPNSEKVYNYEISFEINQQNLINANLETFNVYLTSETDISAFGSNTLGYPSLALLSNYNNNSSMAVSSLLNDLGASLLIELQTEADKKYFLTNVDHRQFLDIDRYKQNAKGTASEKWGYTLAKQKRRQADASGRPISISQNSFGYDFDNSVATQNKNFLRTIRNKAYNEAKGLINIFNYDKIKQTNVPRDVSRNSGVGEINPSFLPGISSYEKQTPLEVETTVQVSAEEKVVKFNLKLRKSQLNAANITSLDSFSILIEASVREHLQVGDSVVDRIIVPVNLERDIDFEFLDLSGFSISNDRATNGEIGFNFNIEQNIEGWNLLNAITFDVHHKYLSRTKPVYLSKFENVATTEYDRIARKSAKFKLATSFKQSSSENSKTVVYVPPTIYTPQFLRITPNIGNYNLDNCVEIGIPAKDYYENLCVPMHVRLEDDKVVMYTYVDALSEFRSIRPVKRDLLKAPYSRGGHFKYKPVGTTALLTTGNEKLVDSAGEPLNHDLLSAVDDTRLPEFTKHGEEKLVKLVKFTDQNVEEGDVFEYRMQLEKSIANVGDQYSAKGFVEEFRFNPRFMTIDASIAAESSSGAVKILGQTSIPDRNTTDIENIFKSMLGDVFDLYSSDLREVRDNLAISTILGVQRIEAQTGEIVDLGFFSQKNVDNNTVQRISDFSITDTNAMDPRFTYVYKINVYAAPILNLLAAARQTFREQAAGRGPKLISDSNPASSLLKYNFNKLANVREKLRANVNTTIISSIKKKMQSPRDLIRGVIRGDEGTTDVFRDASTGDVLYLEFNPRGSFLDGDGYNDIPGTSTGNDTSKGLKTYNGASSTTRITRKKSKTSSGNDISILTMVVNVRAEFNDVIDHAVIFTEQNGKLNYECVMHVQSLKSNYNVLIKKEDCLGDYRLKMFPVDVFGTMYPEIELGTFTV